MDKYTGFEIAIIGMSCRFPGADNTSEFWENIKNGKNSISYFSEEELIENGVTAQEINNPFYVKANSYVKNKEFFDAEFFGYRPEEAMIMDPQIRVFHEVCWEAIEDAGYNLSNCDKNIGLFAGGATNLAWENHAVFLNREGLVDGYTASQVRNVTFMNAIIAYFFNLQGPALYLNTACSTSLVAIQRACLSLLLRECDMALAGGVTINNNLNIGYLYQEGMINSPDGYCRTFDAQANGTVGGEGAGVILLKRLEDAIRDKDNIQAIIKGGAINNDGNNKQAFAAPSVNGQYKNIIKALKTAGVEPSTVGFIETHGTATPLGDPIEVEALSKAYQTLNLSNFCALGSVKPNIGHLDMAAGVAGLIKAVLALKNKSLPPVINYEQPNRNIDFENSAFYVNQALKPWNKMNGRLRRAAVNSLGIGGTNAHVILEEAPFLKQTPDLAEFKLLLFSAKSKQSLYRYLEKFLYFLENEEEAKLEDIAYTLQIGRSSFSHQKAVVCKDREEAKQLLKDLLTTTSFDTEENQKPKVVFMFSGQGSQYVNMGKDLYLNDSYFKGVMDKCFEIAETLCGKDLSAVLFNARPEYNDLDHTEYTQPCLFIIEYALAKTLMNLGITPDVMIGHSIGEYVAACISGVISLEDALAIVIKRGELMSQTKDGRMLSIRITEQVLTGLLKDQPELEIAAINSTGLCVVSGGKNAISTFETLLKESGFEAQPVKASHAFHSSLMEDIRESFENEIRKYSFKQPQIPYVSCLTGHLVELDDLVKPAYWFNQLRHTVKFKEGITQILKLSDQSPLFIEVGPGNVLSSFLNANNEIQPEIKKVNLLRHPRHTLNDYKFFLQSIAELWINGLKLDWEKLYGDQKGKRISVPTYAFEKLKYPVKVDTKRLLSKLTESKIPDEARGFQNWFYTPTWKRGNHLLPVNRAVNSVLVFADQLGIVESLATYFNKNGTTMVIVKTGIEFSEESSGVFTIHPEKEGDYDNLMATLFNRNQVPDKIIHAWSVGKQEVTVFDPLDCYFFSLVKLVRSIGNIGGGVTGKEIVLLTNDLFKISGFEKSILSKSLASGLLKVLSQEYPTVLTSHIDITLKEKYFRKNPKQLFHEIENRSSGKVIALRNGSRWVQSYEQLNDNAFGKDTGVIIKEGVYLVTGGVGKLGYVISKYLLENFQATVILLGRTDLEKVAEYTDEHKASIEKAVDEKIERLTALKQLPGRVFYFKCDIGNASDFTGVNERIERTLGKVNGVFHAAGITETTQTDHLRQTVQFTTADFQDQFKPKVEGLNVLASIYKKQDLDFCILISSISSILGGLGFAGYVPANTYMDFYINAHKSSSKYKNWISVNLDGLDFSLSAVNSHLNEDDVIRVLEKVLGFRHLPQVVISKTDLHVKIENWIDKKYILNDSEDNLTADEYNLNQEADKLLSMEERLLRLWQDFFGKPSIGLNDNFFDIGGDSLKALTLIGRIQKNFNTNISIKDFFDHATVLDLSEIIKSQQTTAEEEEDKADHFFSIPKSEVKEYYRLSSVQNRLYFLYEFDRASLLYNMPRVIRLKGKLDPQLLEGAFRQLILRHEILRTSFVLVGGDPYQHIVEDFDFEITRYTCPIREEEAVINKFIHPFDLGKGPLLRVGLIELDTDHYLLMVDMHHIVMDGVSQGILIRDFMALYNGDQLPELRLQYRDYAEWQQDNGQQERLKDQRLFWLNVYEELPESLNLPLDYVRLADRNRESAKVVFEIGSKQTQQLKLLAEQQGGTLFIVLLALYNILLSRLGNQEDIVIGVPTAGRPHTDVEEMLGMFVNTLAMRNYPIGELRFTEFLRDVKKRSLQYFDNQDYQYEDLIDELKVERSLDHNPLFDVMFAYENLEEMVLELPGLQLESYSREELVAKFDLVFTASERDGKLQLNFEYAKDLFTTETMNRLAGYYQQIVSSITATPDILLGDIEILSAQERQRLLVDFNGQAVIYPANKTVIELFGEQAGKTPGHLAVIGENVSLTYIELEEKSNLVAHYLIKNGITLGDIAGLYMQRSPQMIVYLLGILKAGGTFLAIDPHTTQNRVKEFAEQSGMTLLLTDIEFDVSVIPVTVLHVSQDSHLNDQTLSKGRIETVVAADQPAYIIYTSGSTGDPNGILINHSSLLDYSLTFKNYFGLNEQDKIAQQASLSFDTCIEEIFPILISGGAMVILPNGGLDIDALFEAIEIHQITVLSSVPLVINEINSRWDELSNLRIIISGGDLLQKEHVSNLIGRYQLYNTYGPSESTVCITYNKISTEEDISLLGRPIANRFVYITDKNMNLCPTSTYGELCVSGAGLARGYLNNEKLTNDKFVDHPFRTDGDSKLYKTGDLARWLPDGNIEFLGRKDNQIKIRGFRVELNEIQKKLSKYEGIQDVIVSSGDRFGEKYLVAYYVSILEIPPVELRNYLLEILPNYMVPAYYLRLDQFPVNKNGKIDTKLLPPVVLSAVEITTAAENETQRKLIILWSEVLHIDQNMIGTESNFFDLGGHSLSLLKLTYKINQTFNLDLSVAKMFKYPTVSSLASLIDKPDNFSVENYNSEVKEEIDQMQDTFALLAGRNEENN
ncbi:amino acid adenylation domain-containing protein [Pedobacter cryoconitis]|uniref:Amino acid adenylation domain-containing protein n=1 Tax=Pedobacter cryoconitis TaxID=188932 RepID=A0A7W9DXP8_9SPHI|nr:non-ribosomal peptide synthetase/type I polyketide synthase [Pedobacter cryoconitis]MBB5635106.1 amino acid adenylation domain-containing protein [Pedobacter cryoconitis]